MQPRTLAVVATIAIVAVIAMIGMRAIRTASEPAKSVPLVIPSPTVSPSSIVVPAPVATKSLPLPTTLAPEARLPEPAPTATLDPNAPIAIDLAQALGPGNFYHDDQLALSAVFPDGWSVAAAHRWGPGHLQNTVMLRPPDETSARPSMYYKPYTPGEREKITAAGAETLLREQAQKKEASRVGGVPDYRNVADSFSFFEVNGSPALSYFATFMDGDQVMTEHFIRVLGPNGYVMFFTPGKFEDVKALMPRLQGIAASLKGP